MTTALILFVVKLTLLLGLGAALASLLRGRSAAARHFVWTLTLCSAVVLAIVANAAPPLTLSIPDWRPAINVPEVAMPVPVRTVRAPVTTSATGVFQGRDEAPVKTMPSLESILAGVWLTGFAAMLIWFIAGHAAVSRIARAAVPADDRWSVLIDEAIQRIGVTRRVHVALSPAVAAPFTSGWLHPIVLLPSEASAWPADRRRAALMHEIAHVARNDYLIHFMAGFACALYWFHPVAWFALRRLRRESEQATDDRVIARGMIARDYATHLLDVARAARGHGIVNLMAMSMACPSSLETRLRALLDETRIRSTVSRRLAAAASACVALLLVPLAIAQPELRARRQEAATPRKSVVNTVITGTPSAGRRTVEVSSGGTSVLDPEPGTSSTYRRIVHASSGGTLVLDLETGADVAIIGGDEMRVEINAELRGRDAGRTVIDAAAEGDVVRVTSKIERPGGSSSTSHSFVVRVPRYFNVRLSSAGGNLVISDVEGAFEGASGGGSITLTRLHGRANLTTGGGTVEVTDSTLDGNVSTGGGDVTFAHVLGDLRANSGGPSAAPAIPAVPAVPSVPSMSDLPGVQAVVPVEPVEPVAATKPGGSRVLVKPAHATSPGMLEISKAGGAVELEEAPHGAAISTGGGHITVGRAAGMVDASTGGGRIAVGPIAGSVRAVTGSGNVEITLRDAGGQEQTVDVTTGYGNVIVDLPAGFDGRFEIETAFTASHEPVRIDSAFRLQEEPVTDWDSREGTARRYVRAHGRVGSGRGLVHIRAVNGNVTLRQAN